MNPIYLKCERRLNHVLANSLIFTHDVVFAFAVCAREDSTRVAVRQQSRMRGKQSLLHRKGILPWRHLPQYSWASPWQQVACSLSQRLECHVLVVPKSRQDRRLPAQGTWPRHQRTRQLDAKNAMIDSAKHSTTSEVVLMGESRIPHSRRFPQRR
jgi:hypothetical protein